MKINGFTKIKNYLITSSELDAVEFRILAYLISIQREDMCFPSTSTIATNLGVSQRTVFQKLDALEQKQFILKENRTIGTGKKTSNQYLINEDAISQKIEETTNTQITEKATSDITPDQLRLSEYDWLEEEL